MPTRTVVTACSVPVAPTDSTTSPRLTGSVVTFVSTGGFCTCSRRAAAGDGGQHDDRDDQLFHVCITRSYRDACCTRSNSTKRLLVVEHRAQLGDLRVEQVALGLHDEEVGRHADLELALFVLEALLRQRSAARAASTRLSVLSTFSAALVTSVATVSSRRVQLARAAGTAPWLSRTRHPACCCRSGRRRSRRPSSSGSRTSTSCRRHRASRRAPWPTTTPPSRMNVLPPRPRVP